MPTFSPRAAKPSARLHAVVDLPTPPLADATAMTCLTPRMPTGLDVARACNFPSMADTTLNSPRCPHRGKPQSGSLMTIRSGCFCCLTRSQIVVRGHRCGTLCGMRIETLVDDGRDPAVFAHFHDVDPPGIVALEHPVLSLELGDHAFDRALGAEWFAADDTFERVFFLQYALRRGPCLEIELRNKCDGILGAGRFA